jgi:hypothetical protein
MKPAREAPAKQETAVKPEPQASVVPAEVPQPTSESIAEQAKIEIRPDAAAKPLQAAAAAPQLQEKPQPEKPAAVEPAKPAAAAAPEKPAEAEVATPAV